MRILILLCSFLLTFGCAKNINQNDGRLIVERFAREKTLLAPAGCDDIAAKIESKIGTVDDALQYLNPKGQPKQEKSFTLSLPSFFGSKAHYGSFFPIVMTKLGSGNWRGALENAEEIYAIIKSKYDGKWWEISDTAITIAQIYILVGKFQDAEKYLADADAVLPEKQWAKLSRGMVNSKYAFIRTQTGDLDAAEFYLKKMDAEMGDISIYSYSPKRDWIHFVFGNAHLAKAEYCYATGQLEEAEKEFKKTITLFSDTSYGGLYLDYVVAERATVLAEMGNLDQAEVYVREALASNLEKEGLSPMTGLLLGHLSDIYLRKGELNCSEYMAKAGIKSFSLTGGLSSAAVKAKLAAYLTRIYAAQGKWEQSVLFLDKTREALAAGTGTSSGKGTSLFRLQVALDSSLAYLKLGQYEKADSTLKHGVEAYSFIGLEAGYEYGQAVCMLAIAHSHSAGTKDVESLFGKGVDAILASDFRYSDTGNITDDARMRLIAEEYLSYVATYQPSSQAHLLRALRLMDRIKMGVVADSMRKAAMRRQYDNPDLQQAVRNLQDTELKLRGMYRVAARLYQRDEAKFAVLECKKRIDRLMAERKQLLQRIASESRTAALAVSSDQTDIHKLANALKPGNAYLSFFLGDKSLFACVLHPRKGLALVKKPCNRSSFLDKANNYITNIQSYPATGQAVDSRLAFELYQTLFSGLEKPLNGVKEIAINLDKGIENLPIEALVRREVKGNGPLEWLIRSYAFNYVSSLSSLTQRAGTAHKQVHGLLAFADPDYDGTASFYSLRGISVQQSLTPQDRTAFPPLPETRDEVERIARDGHFSPVQLNMGSQATEGAYRTSDTSRFSVVYFATHGVKAEEIRGLHEPALVLSAQPEVKEDGLLTLGEILGTQLQGSTVVLSACNTASSDGRSTEAYSGLVRAFLYAGATEIYASRWAVDSHATVELMTRAFSQSKGGAADGPQRLRKACLALADSDRYTHPYYWASFVVIGASAR